MSFVGSRAKVLEKTSIRTICKNDHGRNGANMPSGFSHQLVWLHSETHIKCSVYFINLHYKLQWNDKLVNIKACKLR